MTLQQKRTPLTDAVWFTSSRSSGTNGGNCVEVADLGGAVGVRDSKDPDGGALVFDRGAFAAFVAGVQAGEFDLR